MRRSLAITLILALISTVCFASTFSPTLLKFSANETIHYGFDGTDFNFNFHQTGQSAKVIFSVFTKGESANIVDIRNGRYGWHYVNMIDTCVYVAPEQTFSPGSNTIIWDGKNADGNAVESGDYTYYLWGYDTLSAKQQVCSVIPFSWFQNCTFFTTDENGQKLSKPLMIGSSNRGLYGGPASWEPVRFMKWNIGDDPADTALVVDTYVPMYIGGMFFGINPTDYNVFYPQQFTFDVSGLMLIEKRTWVPGEEAEQDLSWGTDGYYSKATTTGDDANSGGCYAVSESELVMLYGCSNHTCLTDGIQYIDINTGEEIRFEDMADTFVWQNNARAGIWQNRVPTNAYLRDGRFGLYEGYATPITCVNLNGSVADGDFWLWKNLVGDIHHDYYDDNPNFAEVGSRSEYTYLGAMDATWHSVQSSYDLGAISFSLTLPDGTGAGYHSFQGDVGGYKAGINVVDGDTAYDGLYVDGTGSGSGGAGWWYIANDSITGTITSGISVKETAPSAFTVAQNSPNPFNPTTTLSFNIAKPGKVTVDIFNVAGQKVDTLVNGNMSAGSHSVVWNASKFSAGVYFYTVKSGSFSKTMKMTLVK